MPLWCSRWKINKRKSVFGSSSVKLSWGTPRNLSPGGKNVLDSSDSFYFIFVCFLLIIFQQQCCTLYAISSPAGGSFVRYWRRMLILLQPLLWRCAECAIHHERDVREEQHPHVCSTNKQQQSDHGMWTLLLLAVTVRSFAHMPLRLSDRNNNNTFCSFWWCEEETSPVVESWKRSGQSTIFIFNRPLIRTTGGISTLFPPFWYH